MMATLRCDHPDIDALHRARRDGALPHFRLAVLLSDAFMQAATKTPAGHCCFRWQAIRCRRGVVAERLWSGAGSPEPCLVRAHRPRAVLWERLLRVAFESGEPGVIFIDTSSVRQLRYAEQLSASVRLAKRRYAHAAFGRSRIARFWPSCTARLHGLASVEPRMLRRPTMQ